MHIQYAMFCQEVELEPFATLRRPIVALYGSLIGSITGMVELPLLVTFIGGPPGNHKLTVETSDPTGSVISVENLDFRWPDDGKTSFATVVQVPFSPTGYGVHTFLLSIDHSARAIPLEFKPAEQASPIPFQTPLMG